MKVVAVLFALSLMRLRAVMCQTTLASTVPPPVLVDLEAELTKRREFKQFLNLLGSAGLLDKLKNAANITVFAPTDAALAQLPSNQLLALQSDPVMLQKILGYHVLLEDLGPLNGLSRRFNDKVIRSSNNMTVRICWYYLLNYTLTAEGVEITEQSIPVSNGYVHALDGIMTPPEGNVVDILTADGGFTTFLSLVTTANLTDYLKSDMPITVFAPNDLSFTKINPKIIAYLMSNPQDLSSFVRYHMLRRGTVYSIGMRHGFLFLSKSGRRDRLMVLEDFATGELKINSATIVHRDISATNGVIHVIDEVLVPAHVLLKAEGSGITIG